MYKASLMPALAALVIVTYACDPQTFPPDASPMPAPPVPSNVAEACVVACENLRDPKVNCPEGFGSVGGEPCAVTCVTASRLRSLPLACWVAAKSDVEARSCGSLRCRK